MLSWFRTRKTEDDEERQSLLGEGSASSTIGALKNKAAIAVGLAKPEPPPSACSCLPELSYTTRIAGFAFCFMLGLLLSLTSMSSFASLLTGHPGPFAFKYTLGNCLSLCSYCFLVGPRAQCAGMFAPTRVIATIAYLGSFALTLISIFVLRSFIVTIVAICLQFVAMLYYALSYIPFVQKFFFRALGF